jgi:6-phosphogluconolactonase (cycloisomerase 2 family)
MKFACLIAALCAPAAFAQMKSVAILSKPVNLLAGAPVAYVYVSSNPNNSSTNQINAYTTSADGRLTPVTGSPFADDVTSMAANGKYLFGSTRNGIYVAAFRIESNGALQWSKSTDIVQFNPDDCGNSGPLFLDHTGATVYDMEYRSDCSNNSYQALGVNQSTGQLHNLGSSGPDEWLSLPASFIGNNVYAYSAMCLSNTYWEINGYKRSSTGALSSINITAPTPTPKAGDFFCPSQTAADPANHLAITLQAVDQNFNPDGPPQLATYTVDASGNLHTASTLQNMPRTSVGTVTDLKMAPLGNLVAVAGAAGLQVFHFNGSNPITAGTGLLTKDEIDQAFWDNAHHLYAISQSAGKLYVFTVTALGATQAPGSPYTISHPQNIAVQPRTPAL